MSNANLVNTIKSLRRLHPVELAFHLALIAATGSGCGTTPREQVGSEERWFTATVDVLTQARLTHAIDKNDYHHFVLPAEEAANAALDNVHRQAATQPSVNVDHLLAADAAWQEAKAALLRWLLTANEKK
jgi:hypothetical protein